MVDLDDEKKHAISHKHFHKMLCDVFNYPHDDEYWWRDQVSLIDHIAKDRQAIKLELDEIKEQFQLMEIDRLALKAEIEAVTLERDSKEFLLGEIGVTSIIPPMTTEQARQLIMITNLAREAAEPIYSKIVEDVRNTNKALNIARDELRLLREEIEAARKQEPIGEWRIFNAGRSGEFGRLISDFKFEDGKKFYANPIPEKISKEVARALINTAISENPELLDLFTKADK